MLKNVVQTEEDPLPEALHIVLQTKLDPITNVKERTDIE